jgi:ribosome biogenesis GTPase A
MKKTRELIAANLKLVDVAIEVCDARIPISSRNPIIDELLSDKERILILNKSDLADSRITAEWLAYYRQHEMADLRTALPLNSREGEGLSSLLTKLEKVEKEKTPPEGLRLRKPLRMMICGVPNSGKSSLINRLMKKKSAQIGDRPGITKGKQWLTLENGMQLLDTPGILWPKFEDPQVGLNLAFCGAIKDEIMDIPELGLELLRILLRDYPGDIAKRFSIQTELQSVALNTGGGEIEAQFDEDGVPMENDPTLLTMKAIAKKRGYILPGKKIDYERTARQLLDEFRAAKIGRITLERPPIPA